jgi:hypothetical protein
VASFGGLSFLAQLYTCDHFGKKLAFTPESVEPGSIVLKATTGLKQT